MLQEAIGDVAYISIEIDENTDYPKGAARTVFCTQEAYIKAIAMREIPVHVNGYERVAELKPYVISKMKCETCQFYGKSTFLRWKIVS